MYATPKPSGTTCVLANRKNPLGTENKKSRPLFSNAVPSSGRAYLASLFAPSNSFGDQQNATHLGTSSDFAHIVELSRSSRPSPAPPEASYMSYYPLLTIGVVASTPPLTVVPPAVIMSSPTLAVPPISIPRSFDTFASHSRLACHNSTISSVSVSPTPNPLPPPPPLFPRPLAPHCLRARGLPP